MFPRACVFCAVALLLPLFPASDLLVKEDEDVDEVVAPDDEEDDEPASDVVGGAIPGPPTIFMPAAPASADRIMFWIKSWPPGPPRFNPPAFVALPSEMEFPCSSVALT